MTRKERAAFGAWVNSLNVLDSERLSQIGIDDFGDLCDEVPAIKEWMNRFFELLWSTDKRA